MESAVWRDGFAIDAESISAVFGDDGVSTMCGEGDGKAAVHGQIDSWIAFAPVFDEGNIAGSISLAAWRGGQAGWQMRF